MSNSRRHLSDIWLNTPRTPSVDDGNSFGQEYKPKESKKVKPKTDLYKLAIKLEKISIKSGDILLVKLQSALTYSGTQALIKQITSLKPISELKIPVFILTQGVTLEAVNEEGMNKAGWFKRTKLRSLRIIRRGEVDLDRIPKELNLK